MDELSVASKKAGPFRRLFRRHRIVGNLSPQRSAPRGSSDVAQPQRSKASYSAILQTPTSTNISLELEADQAVASCPEASLSGQDPSVRTDLPLLLELPRDAEEASSQKPRAKESLPRDLWDEALRSLSSKETAFLAALNPESLTNTSVDLHAILQDVEKQKRQCQIKRWRVRMWGRTWVLQDLASKVCGLLDKLKYVGDIAVNADPLHAGLPWALIRPLIHVVVSNDHQMAALLLGLHKVTWLISRSQIYERLFIRESEPSDAKMNLESALIELYTAILEFLAKARGLYLDTSLARMGHAFLHPDDVGEFYMKCEAQAAYVETAARDCAIVDARESRQRQSAMVVELRAVLNDMKDDTFARLDTKLSDLWGLVHQERREKILRWISNIPVKDHHGRARVGRTPGTGEWLIENDKYRSWRASNTSMILWLHGIPGAGKTKLVSRVIDDRLEKIQNESQDDEAVAYFYCDRNDDPLRIPANILLSLIKQLSIRTSQDTVHYLLVQAYNEKEKEGFLSNTLSVAECSSLLSQLIETFPRTTLIVDALDECDLRLRRDFMKVLEQLVGSCLNLKILVSSRRDQDIQLQLEKRANIGISATDNGKDVATYLAQSFLEDERSDFIPRELQEEIIQTLLVRSEGMFQWVVLQMGQLFELGRVEDVKEYLGKLPPDLEATYKQLFVAIQSQRGSRPHIAARAFQWIMSSIIPLSPDRLLAAVCQDPEKDEVNEVTVDIDFILGACRNLLVVDRVQNKCRFAHLSIQEYLEQNHWTPHESNTLVTKVCLLVLQTPDEWTHGTSGSLILQQSSAVPDDYETSNRAYAMSTLLSYSRFYWVSHIKEHEKGEIDDRVAMLLKRFLGSMDASSPAYQRWFEQSPRVHSYHSQVVDLSTRLRPSTSASFAVACFGFHGLLSDWWKLGFTNIDQQNEFGDSLLVLAAESWSAETVRKVLQMGANVNALGGRYGSALNCALNQGQRSIIELLLKNEAEVNFRDFGQDSVLLLALWERYRDVPEHARSGWIDDIRELATETVWGNKETIRRLLENGADPNATGSKIDAPISLSHITVKLPPPPQSAIDTLEEKRRCLKIVRHFLEGITDLDTGAYGSALIAAVCSQSAEIVRRLIDRGANVNLEAGGMYGSALSAAVQRAVGIHASALMKNKRILIMHLLLEAGANVTEHIRHAAEGDSTINDILQRYASVE